MKLIAGGIFHMGAAASELVGECGLFREGCQTDWFNASEPVHSVLLGRFYLDMHEVTNQAFATFLNENGPLCGGQPCLDVEQSDLTLTGDNFNVEPSLMQNPAAGITWYGAASYCEWRGARLPTEAEWERAAAWDDATDQARHYPWGDDFDGQLANFCDASCREQQANAEFNDGFPQAAPVASFEGGLSSTGIYDLAGNVWEWVADWYDPNYYSHSAGANPTGPFDGEEKVVRGGSWFDTGNFTASAIRFPSPPENADRTIGFRCALNLP